MDKDYTPQKPFDREKLKQELIDAYYQMHELEDDVLDFQGKASELEEPFVIQFKKAIIEYRRKRLANTIGDADQGDLEEIEELEEDFEPIVDIEVLDEIEDMVIRTLQYLNLELYDFEKLKDFFVSMSLIEFKNRELSESMKERISFVVQGIVEHEFRELDNKRQFRKETLVNNAINEFSNKISEILQNQKNVTTKKLTNFQKKNLHKFIITTLSGEAIDEFKKKHKLSYEELRFVENIMKKLAFKQVAAIGEAV